MHAAPAALWWALDADNTAADTKIVYRRYASLFFIAGCSSEDNELITLEIIHRYVEQMDKYYGNVCELDIIFSFTKAYYILDELLLAGELQESSKKNVLRCISQQDSLEDMEVGHLPPCAVTLSVESSVVADYLFPLRPPISLTRLFILRSRTKSRRSCRGSTSCTIVMHFPFYSRERLPRTLWHAIDEFPALTMANAIHARETGTGQH